MGVAHTEGLGLTPDTHGHPTVIVEQGRFCFARCGCGWRGPARRARSQARTDGATHEGSTRG
ncbi:hypothetical protein [Streptomyces sp. NPDC101249]|uniref:hypothetical protein n=1 Tax=unclassified Streptomyces TaxID=2593676 RepID=UPI00380E8E04